jgi:hypothetical protein
LPALVTVIVELVSFVLHNKVPVYPLAVNVVLPQLLVAVIVGVDGVDGCAEIVFETTPLLQPLAFVAVKLYDPDVNELNTPVVFVIVPEAFDKLNVNPLVPLVTLIVPVETLHVGSVTDAVGVGGAVGGTRINTEVAGLVQPSEFVAVKL